MATTRWMAIRSAWPRHEGALMFLLDREALRRHQWLNRLQSGLLLGGLGLLAAATGGLIAGQYGMVMAFLGALLLLWLEPLSGAAGFRHAFGAVELHPAQAPQLHALVRELAARAALPRMPAIYLIPSRQLQAMAGGRAEEPVVAVTAGLLHTLSLRELAGVMAHEIAHLRHGDLQVMRLASTAATLTRSMGLAGSIMLALWLPSMLAMDMAPSPLAVMLLLAAPTAGELLALSLSRRREFLADAGAVDLTGDPAGLASALRRLHAIQGDDWERLATRSGAWWLRWLRTHPTIAERVERLAETVSRTPVIVLPQRAASLSDLALRRALPGQGLARRWLM